MKKGGKQRLAKVCYQMVCGQMIELTTDALHGRKASKKTVASAVFREAAYTLLQIYNHAHFREAILSICLLYLYRSRKNIPGQNTV